jgi:hypothetical protein
MSVDRKKIGLQALRIGAFLAGVLFVILTVEVTHMLLKYNFRYSGEAYWKGEGRLLDEHFWKGILFLFIRHLGLSTCGFYMLFGFFAEGDRKWLFRVLLYPVISIIVMTTAYTIYQAVQMYTEGYDITNRVVEIAMTWGLRVAGYLLGYRLANRVFNALAKRGQAPVGSQH